MWLTAASAALWSNGTSTDSAARSCAVWTWCHQYGGVYRASPGRQVTLPMTFNYFWTRTDLTQVNLSQNGIITYTMETPPLTWAEGHAVQLRAPKLRVQPPLLRAGRRVGAACVRACA